MNALCKIIVTIVLTGTLIAHTPSSRSKDLRHFLLGTGYGLLALGSAATDYYEVSGLYQGLARVNNWKEVESKTYWQLIRKLLIINALTYTTYTSGTKSIQNFKKISPNNPTLVTLKGYWDYIKSYWPFGSQSEASSIDDIIKHPATPAATATKPSTSKPVTPTRWPVRRSINISESEG